MTTKRFRIPKQILSIVLALAMVLAMLPVSPLTASAATTTSGYDGTPVTPTQITSENYAAFGLTADNWSSYNGYYGIRTAAELYGFAELVNSINGWTSETSAVLLADIIVNTGTVTESGSSIGTTYSWTPIGLGTVNSSGKGAPHFTGTFDGNGHTISGLYCNTTDSEVGLFSSTGYSEGATIKNVIIANSYFGGSSYVGGIVGYAFWNTTTISNCKVSSDVTVKGTDRFVGGIVGGSFLNDSVDNGNDNQVINCVNFGTVTTTASTNAVGGIAGAWAKETDCLDRVITCTNCYYLTNCASNASGTISWACGTYIDNNGWADNTGCTAITSANASHTHVTVEHKEMKATCLSTGLSYYAVCLICDQITAGEKTVYDIDETYHVSSELIYENDNATTHKVVHKCCNAFVKTEAHNFQGGNCITSEMCSLCKGDGTTYPDIHATTETVMKVLSSDNTKHADYRKCCDTLISGTEASHTYTNGICSGCNYECPHETIIDGSCSACGEESVKYLCREWDGSKVVTTEKDTQGMPTIVTSGTTEMSDGWYLVTGDTAISNVIYISGTVHLILADNSHLTANKGINVPPGVTLYIYAQSNNKDVMGKLTSKGKQYQAGIGGGGTYSTGGSTGQACGTVIINGGTITVTGGMMSAGIGGGYRGGTNNITINGGYVTATGREAAGIGGGYQTSNGTIVINGGTIIATGSYGGAGIGGGSRASGGSITINGGTIKASTNEGDKGSDVGAGYNGSGGTLKNASGNNVSLKTITLNGASDDTLVTAMEGMDNYGITDVRTLDTNKLYFYLPSDPTATSITAGDTDYVCNRSNTFYAEHNWIEASCINGKHCTECGLEESAALEHDFVNGICTMCGIDTNGDFYISTAEQLVLFAR